MIIGILVVLSMALIGAYAFGPHRMMANHKVSLNPSIVTSRTQLAATSDVIKPEKVGAQFLESLNGTDVRVGIIRASWNDIIE